MSACLRQIITEPFSQVRATQSFSWKCVCVKHRRATFSELVRCCFFVYLCSDPLSLSDARWSAWHFDSRDTRDLRDRHGSQCRQRYDTRRGVVVGRKAASQQQQTSSRHCRIDSRVCLIAQFCPSVIPSSHSAFLPRRPTQPLPLLLLLPLRKCSSCTATICASAATNAARGNSKQRRLFSFEQTGRCSLTRLASSTPLPPLTASAQARDCSLSNEIKMSQSCLNNVCNREISKA